MTTAFETSDRIRPLVALRAVRQLIRNPEDTALVFEVLRALNGRTDLRGVTRLRRFSPELFAARDALLTTLQDREKLAALPADSLGAHYLALLDRAGITPDGLVEASEQSWDRSQDNNDRVWYGNRMRDSHDLWHLTTGYGTDTFGELCLLAFTFAQTRSPGIALIVAFGVARTAEQIGWKRAIGAVSAAFRAGQRAAWLPGVRWENLLGRPLAEVRGTLNIPPPSAYLAVLADPALNSSLPGARTDVLSPA